MADDREGNQELTVKGREAGLGVGQLPGEESQGGPRLLHTLLEYPTHVCISDTAREIGAPGTGCMRMGTEERMFRAWRKAVSRVGVQSNSLPGPLWALMRGAKINEAFLINFL